MVCSDAALLLAVMHKPSLVLTFYLVLLAMTSVLQWKIRGVRANSTDLQCLLSSHNPAVVCLQETKLSPEVEYTNKLYKIYRRDLRQRTIAHGGVAVLVHHGVPCSSFTLQTCLQAVAVTVDLGVMRPTICSIYIPPGDNIDFQDLESVIDQLHPPYLILGDSPIIQRGVELLRTLVVDDCKIY